MTDVTTAATRSNMAPAFASPSFEMPKFDLPNMEMPDLLRETVEKAASQAKDTCEKAKVAAEQAADLLKDIYATAAKGATDYNLKLIELARTNTNTTFEYAQELMGGEIPVRARRAIDRTCPQKVRDDDRADKRTDRNCSEGDHRDDRATQGRDNQGAEHDWLKESVGALAA